MQRMLEPERNHVYSSDPVVNTERGEHEQVSQLLPPWDAVEIRSALKTTDLLGRVKKGPRPFFVRSPKLLTSRLCAGHFISSEEDEPCDALESAFVVGISRLAQSWQITTNTDHFGMAVPKKSQSR